MQSAEVAKAPIDVDRGVTIRQIVKFDKVNQHKFEPDMKYGGLTVYMYKDDPGIYYDVHGNKIPDGMAKLAGYPVDKLSKARRKKEALQIFEREMAKQLNMEEDEEVRILAEAGDWQVIGLPAGRAKIIDKETGDLITRTLMPEKDALALLKELTDTDADLKVATASATPTTKGK